MKVGDLVSYNMMQSGICDLTAVIVRINEEGGTVQALLSSGKTRWLVKSGCEVISESR